ncbi:MAG: sporulation protein YtfJ [Hyphomicrobiales bacterium]|nr:sporulation protein YtfJ [Hyphomicrobiales bacterium]
MDDVERLLKGTVEELERLLHARNVLAEPIEKGGATIIPLVSYGFGFGAGGGKDRKSGNGGGTGAGGGIKPRGAIIIDDDGVRVESLKSGIGNIFETMADCCARMMEKKSSSDGKEDKGAAAKNS